MRFRLIRIKKLPIFMINRNTVKTQETKSWGAGNTKNYRRLLLTEMTPGYEGYSENTFTV